MNEHEITVTAIGRVASSVGDPSRAARQPDEGAPPADIVVDPSFAPGLLGLEVGVDILVVTWLDQADRSVLQVHPRGDATRQQLGVFATRSQHRPNPIGLHETRIVAIDGLRIRVAHLEAVDGTPVIDLKPTLEPIVRR